MSEQMAYVVTLRDCRSKSFRLPGSGGMIFLLRRMGFSSFTAWMAATMSATPHPILLDLILTRYRSEATPRQVHALETTFGLNTNQGLADFPIPSLSEPAFSRRSRDLHHLLPEKVSTVIAHALPWTILLVGFATVVAFIGGTLIGITVAWRRGSWTDGVLPVTTFFSAVPFLDGAPHSQHLCRDLALVPSEWRLQRFHVAGLESPIHRLGPLSRGSARHNHHHQLHRKLDPGHAQHDGDDPR